MSRTYIPVDGPRPDDLPSVAAITPLQHMPATAPPMRPLSSLLASATRLTSERVKNSHSFQKSTAEQWQEDAWEMYDLVGELRFLANVLGGQMAKARFYVGTVAKDATDPPIPSDNKQLQDVLESVGDGPSGLAQLIKRLAVNLYIPGDGWLVGIPQDLLPGAKVTGPPRTLANSPLSLDDLDWRMLSVSEVQFKAGSDVVLLLGDDSVNDKVTATPDDLWMIRVWSPHPRRVWEATSPTRSALPVLRELVGLTMHISAQIDSRLAGAGVIIAPDSAARAAKRAMNLPEDAPDDPFTDALIKAMMTPISDRSNASAYVPLVWTVPDESAPLFRYLDQGDRVLDSQAKDMRDESIRRFALSADAPPELLLGMGTMNHWGAWIVQEDVVHAHLEPPLALIADAFTTQYLRPVMRQLGYPPEVVDETVVWYSVEHLISRPNRGADAQNLHEQGVISDEALRTAYGFGEDDAPAWSALEPASQMAMKMIEANPSLLANPGLTALVQQFTALLNGQLIEPIATPEPEPQIVVVAPPAQEPAALPTQGAPAPDVAPSPNPLPIAASGVPEFIRDTVIPHVAKQSRQADLARR